MTLFLHKTKFCRFAFLRLPGRSKKIYVCGFVGCSDCRFARVLSMVFIWSFSELPNAFFLPAAGTQTVCAHTFSCRFPPASNFIFSFTSPLLSRLFPQRQTAAKTPVLESLKFFRSPHKKPRLLPRSGFVFNFSVSSQSRLCNRKQLQSAKPSFYPCVFPESSGKETLSRRLSRRPSLPPESDPICLGFPLPSGPAFVTILYSMRQR